MLYMTGKIPVGLVREARGRYQDHGRPIKRLTKLAEGGGGPITDPL